MPRNLQKIMEFCHCGKVGATQKVTKEDTLLNIDKVAFSEDRICM